MNPHQWGPWSMMSWYVVRSLFALLAFVLVVVAAAIQIQLGVNPVLAYVDVLVAAAITFPVTRPIVRMLQQPPPPPPSAAAPASTPVHPVPPLSTASSSALPQLPPAGHGTGA